MQFIFTLHCIPLCAVLALQSDYYIDLENNIAEQMEFSKHVALYLRHLKDNTKHSEIKKYNYISLRLTSCNESNLILSICSLSI